MKFYGLLRKENIQKEPSLVVLIFPEPFLETLKICILEQTKNLMINKIVKNVTEACADIQDSATIMLGGFGLCGIPEKFYRRTRKRS